MRLLLRFIVLLLVAVGSTPCQQTWNVNCQGGPGVHFTDLPQAVAAAAPGDEIRVYKNISLPSCPALTYYTSPIIDKPLRIVGFGVGLGPGVGVQGGILIVGLEAGEQVVLSSLNVAQGSGLSGIVALNCQGSILLEDCFYGSAGTDGTYLRIENCAEVVVRGCNFRIGGSPLEVINTNLLITSSRIENRGPNPFAPFSETAPALHVTNSTVTITESILDGSDAYSIFWPPSSYVERPGMVIASGTVRVGPGALVRGGWHPEMYFPNGGYHGFGYQVTGPNAVVELDPRGTIYQNSLPPPIPAQIHTTAHNVITAGESYQVLVAGPLGGFAVLAVGDWLPAGVSTPFGSLRIDPMTIQVDSIVALSPTDGRYLWQETCPGTVPVAHAFAFQAAVLSPAGVISLTVPSPFAVGWPANAIP